MEQLQKLIDEYVKWTQENRMAGKKIAVYLGLQVEQSPKHVAFYEAVGEWAKTFAAGQPEHEQMVAACGCCCFPPGSIWAARAGVVSDRHSELCKGLYRRAERGGKDAAGVGIPEEIPLWQTASPAK